MNFLLLECVCFIKLLPLFLGGIPSCFIFVVNAFHIKKFLPLFNAVRIDICLVRYILLLLLLLLSRFSRVRLCAMLWTVAHQPPLSTGFSRQEYWSGLPFPSPRYILLTRITPLCSYPFVCPHVISHIFIFCFSGSLCFRCVSDVQNVSESF